MRVLHNRSELLVSVPQSRVPHAISILCMNDMKAQMMGLSALNCPGLSTLLLNLCRTVSHYLPIEVDAKPWQYEYWWGAGMEIFRAPLSPHFQVRPLVQIATRSCMAKQRICLKWSSNAPDRFTQHFLVPHYPDSIRCRA